MRDLRQDDERHRIREPAVVGRRVAWVAAPELAIDRHSGCDALARQEAACERERVRPAAIDRALFPLEGCTGVLCTGDPLRPWRYNRAAQLVNFRIDTRGRVCAEGWVPKAGLTAEEFQLVLRRVADESDRFEFMLTGKDIE